MGTKISAEPSAADLTGAVILLGNQDDTTKTFPLSLFDARYVLATDPRLESAKHVILAKNWVLAQESTTSSTFTDLTTLDTLTVTLSETSDLLIEYAALQNGSVGGNLLGNQIVWAGTPDTTCEGYVTVNGAFYAQWGFVQLNKPGVAPGTYAVKIRHNVSAGGTGYWQSRLLKVTRTA